MDSIFTRNLCNRAMINVDCRFCIGELFCRHRRASSDPTTACTGGSHACPRSFADQRPLKFGHRCEDMQQQPTGWRASVEAFAQRPELDTALIEIADQRQQFEQ